MGEVMANEFPRNEIAATNTQAGAMISRQAQEVQMAMYVAKTFPRDEALAYNRVMTACRRKSLAMQAQYEYPRGGQKVSGPSIRLAEVLARAWGNIDFGITELENKGMESQVMAYAWDLETNTRQTKIFSVKHERYTKKGINKLEDPRDIYEMVANNGARRLRACILGIIPGDVVDAAIDECNKTLVEGHKEPLVDRVRKLIDQFSNKFSVSKEMLEKYIGCSSTAWSEMDVIRLGRVFISLRDGMSKREDYFDLSLSAKTEIKNNANVEVFETADNAKPQKKNETVKNSTGKPESRNESVAPENADDQTAASANPVQQEMPEF